jgi:4-hydroxy-3-polyprenylbenzoate decarboxylase
LLEADARVARIHLVVTDTGARLLAHELGIATSDAKKLPSLLIGGRAEKTEVLPNKDVGASIASGSYPVDAMVVIPCSMGTLATIAAGMSDDLIARAADVCLKEGRRLVLCVRDTPFSRIHLENMLRAQQAGAVIMPAIPSFYHQPKTIDDLVAQYVYRVLAQMGLPQERCTAGKGRKGKARGVSGRTGFSLSAAKGLISQRKKQRMPKVLQKSKADRLKPVVLLCAHEILEIRSEPAASAPFSR